MALAAAAVAASVRSFVRPLYVKGNFLSLAGLLSGRTGGGEEEGEGGMLGGTWEVGSC